MMFRRRKRKKSRDIRKQYRKGDVIIEEGLEDLEEAYSLRSGKVEVSRNIDGEKTILATLKPGDIFGELGLTDKRPRTTSVTAIEDVEVDVINMNNLDETIQSNPESLIPVLRMLFERIRTLNAMVASQKHKTIDNTNWKVTMTGVTEQAQEALNGDSFLIETLPFRVGRESPDLDVMAYNDLTLTDKRPYHVSRNHFMIRRTSRGISIVDRGSTLGTIVNGHRIGSDAKEKRILLKEGENELIVGTEDSPCKFRVMLERD